MWRIWDDICALLAKNPPAASASRVTDTSKWAQVEDADDEDADEERKNAQINPRPSKGVCYNLNDLFWMIYMHC